MDCFGGGSFTRKRAGRPETSQSHCRQIAFHPQARGLTLGFGDADQTEYVETLMFHPHARGLTKRYSRPKNTTASPAFAIDSPASVRDWPRR